MNFGDSRLDDRFWSKVQPCPMTGCWIWVGAIQPPGYGSLRRRAVSKSTMTAHSHAYRTLVGEVPEGLELDHKCRTPACCNPSHLEPVTHAENLRRAPWARHNPEFQKFIASHRQKREACACGRPYDLVVGARKLRGCSHCRLQRQRAWHKRRREGV